MNGILIGNNSMSKDHNWEVRCTAASILGKICWISPQNSNQSSFLEIFKRFHEDHNSRIRETALLQVGKLISSFIGGAIPKYLLDLYITLSDPTKTTNDEVVFQCAYTFPAVLQAVEMKEWPSLLEVYKKMIASNKSKTVMTLVASIHEVASIVGSGITTNELDPIVKGFLNNSKTVNAALSNLHEFIPLLTQEQMPSYFSLMTEILNKANNN